MKDNVDKTHCSLPAQHRAADSQSWQPAGEHSGALAAEPDICFFQERAKRRVDICQIDRPITLMNANIAP